MATDVEFREWTKKYFGFLLSEYGFIYNEDKNRFESNSIRITIEQYDRRLPSIMLWLKTEPKFTTILFDRLLKEHINYKEMDKFLMEDCFKYYSSVFQKHANTLIYNLDSLLLTGMKRSFIDNIKWHWCMKELTKEA